MHSEPAIGTRMMVPPYLSHKQEWVAGTLIEVEHNRYRGLVYVVRTDAGEIFFSVTDDFKPVTRTSFSCAQASPPQCQTCG